MNVLKSVVVELKILLNVALKIPIKIHHGSLRG